MEPEVVLTLFNSVKEGHCGGYIILHKADEFNIHFEEMREDMAVQHCYFTPPQDGSMQELLQWINIAVKEHEHFVHAVNKYKFARLKTIGLINRTGRGEVVNEVILSDYLHECLGETNSALLAADLTKETLQQPEHYHYWHYIFPQLEALYGFVYDSD